MSFVRWKIFPIFFLFLLLLIALFAVFLSPLPPYLTLLHSYLLPFPSISLFLSHFFPYLPMYYVSLRPLLPLPLSLSLPVITCYIPQPPSSLLSPSTLPLPSSSSSLLYPLPSDPIPHPLHLLPPPSIHPVASYLGLKDAVAMVGGVAGASLLAPRPRMPSLDSKLLLGNLPMI